MLADLRALMELLADKLPGQVWILLPSPSLWPESQRDAVLRIRQELSNPREGVRLIDVEEEVHAFLAAQDPEHGDPADQKQRAALGGRTDHGDPARRAACSAYFFWMTSRSNMGSS